MQAARYDDIRPLFFQHSPQVRTQKLIELKSGLFPFLERLCRS